MTRFTPLWIQQGDYSALTDRQLIAALWPTEAVTGMSVTPGTGLTVSVAQGKAVVAVQSAANAVLCSSNAVEVVALQAAHASLPRVDRIVCQVRANDIDGGANNDWIFQAVQGTAAASPVAPAEPANAVSVATVAVPAASVTVTAGNITDVRPPLVNQPWNSAWGEVAYATLTTAVNGITALQDTGLSATWSSCGNRKYLVTAALPNVLQATANGQQLFQLADQANAVMTNAYQAATSAVPNTYNAFVQGRLIVSTNTTVTRKLRASTSAGTMNLVVGAGVPGWLRVDDIGPSGTGPVPAGLRRDKEGTP